MRAKRLIVKDESAVTGYFVTNSITEWLRTCPIEQFVSYASAFKARLEAYKDALRSSVSKGDYIEHVGSDGGRTRYHQYEVDGPAINHARFGECFPIKNKRGRTVYLLREHWSSYAPRGDALKNMAQLLNIPLDEVSQDEIREKVCTYADILRKCNKVVRAHTKLT